jgi:hypothetical protein
MANGYFDGDISAVAASGAYYKVTLINGSLTHLFDTPSLVDLRSSWSLVFRTWHVGNTGNSHYLFCLGVDGANGVPTGGINVGIEIPDQFSARLWQCNNAAPIYSSAGVLPSPIANTAVSGDHNYWLDCNGSSNTMSLYCAFKPFASVMPVKPTTPICTLTGIPAAATSASSLSIFCRATAANPALFTAIGVRDCTFIEY